MASQNFPTRSSVSVVKRSKTVAYASTMRIGMHGSSGCADPPIPRGICESACLPLTVHYHAGRPSLPHGRRSTSNDRSTIGPRIPHCNPIRLASKFLGPAASGVKSGRAGLAGRQGLAGGTGPTKLLQTTGDDLRFAQWQPGELEAGSPAERHRSLARDDGSAALQSERNTETPARERPAFRVFDGLLDNGPELWLR